MDGFKQKYQKYKLRVKLWEKDFKKTHSRVPSKYDIREAPQGIRDSYKMYYKLKTSFLEDTLNDVLSDDGFDLSEIMQSEGVEDAESTLNESLDAGPTLPMDISGIMETSQTNVTTHTYTETEMQVVKKFEAVDECKSNENAWGSAVSKITPAAKGKGDGEIKLNSEKKFSRLNLKEKLFNTSSFSKRNPRKSLSRTSLNATSQHNSQKNLNDLHQSKEVLPDLETILTQKAKEQQMAAVITINPLLTGDKTRDVLKTKLDEGWLKRTGAMNGFDEQTTSTTVERGTHLAKPTYGLSNINISKMVLPQTKEEQDASANQNNNIPPVACDSDSVVSGSEDESKLNQSMHVAKRRRLMRNFTKNDVKSNGAAIEIKPTETGNDEVKDQEAAASSSKGRKKKAANEKCKKPKNTMSRRCTRNTKTADVAAVASKGKLEESVNAEDELEEPPNPVHLRCMMAMEQSDVTSVPRVKVSELKSVNDVANQYISTVAINASLSNTTQSQAVVNNVAQQKQQTNRMKLEEKIASGKLNENFVTINIQKKKFVRGKKTINYSKYKKKMWKNKKREAAALCGPDMDMGGCDGGVLKCFTCGMPGHFAQQCKVKGDALLPLAAASLMNDDDSPFPTLDEAELMATQNATAAHSRNIAKLPAAANKAIYNGAKESATDSSDSSSDSNHNNNNNNENDELVIETDDEFDNIALDVERDRNDAIKTGYTGHKIPEDFLKQMGLDEKSDKHLSIAEMTPLYDLNADGSTKEVTAEVLDALRMFGHDGFRKGQDRAVMRILSGLSTLVTLSTGSGKSLCYQLPAYLYSRQKKAITLVVSPLVSLMEDQVTGVPHFLRAHCLHTNQTPQQRAKVLQLIRDGECDILLISPEAVVAGERSTGFGSLLHQLPPIAFACIDEAHCVSQWSHNFRPSYLMICKVLRKNLGVRTVLGLTATATLSTRQSIIEHLGIEDGVNGVISDIPLPHNLILSVSKDEKKDFALLELLNSKRFTNCHSIIIYCTRRDECERIAGFLRTCMQDRKTGGEEPSVSKKRKRVNWHAEPYHAGMAASRRRVIQNAFMRNELRIVVATIAFGMGINKPDIRAIIHYNMPRNFESYVQEIGRSGRDGLLSHCHLFLDAQGGDRNELQRHIYANSIDRHVIRKLLQRIYVPCACQKNMKRTELNLGGTQMSKCPGHEIGFSIEKTVEALDIPQENIATLLCYMELDTRWNINVLSSAYTMAKVISYGGPKCLKVAAKQCPPLAMAIALGIKNNTFTEESNLIEFSVVDIAAAIGWNSGVVKFQLKNLEWIDVAGHAKRSSISVNFFDLGFRVKAPGDFTAEEIDEALDTLYNRSVKQEHTQLMQLQYVFQGLSSVAYNSYVPCANDNFTHDRSDQLKGIIRDYFQNDYPKDLKLEIDSSSARDGDIEDDIHGIINMYPENNFSGRTIARIFHGISSPNYPAVMWGRCKYWRAHSKTDFNRIVQLANTVIVKRRT